MILIVGGAYQGKLKMAWGLLPDAECKNPDRAFGTGEPDREERAGLFVADGEKDSLEDAMRRPIIDRLHEYIRRFCLGEAGYMDAERVMWKFLERLVYENPDAIVICDELGCGIVPMNKQDRIWREMTGDACQFLAERSTKVYRVVCGIPTALKGGRP